MVVGEMPESVDFLVVGGGPGGYAAALAAAQLGRQVVLVDGDGLDGLGGTCLRVGCIPSKALIEFAEHRHQGAAWRTRQVVEGDSTISLKQFQSWKDGVVADLNRGVRGLLKAEGVAVRQGRFRFTRSDQGVLSRSEEEPPEHLRFKSCVIATGSRPATLDVLPFDGHRVLSSTDILAATEPPRSLVVVGGGYIGVELGVAYAKLGTAVTLVEAEERLLPALPAEAGTAVAATLEQLGASVILSARVSGDRAGTLHLEQRATAIELPCDRILVAVGRTTNTDDLGIEALGVGLSDRGVLQVGADLMLTDNVAAVGDVTPGPALAHKATAQARVAAANLSGSKDLYSPRATPEIVFSDPEVAQTGVTEAQALAVGIDVERAAFPVAGSGKARVLGARSGHAEWLIARDTQVVIGATIIGPRASELIAEATLAIEMSATLEDLTLSSHPHPTMSEVLHEAAAVGLGEPLHVPRTPR